MAIIFRANPVHPHTQGSPTLETSTFPQTELPEAKRIHLLQWLPGVLSELHAAWKRTWLGHVLSPGGTGARVQAHSRDLQSDS